MPKYMIHEHTSKNPHWDLRLESGGVLKSWALPKFPPTKRNVKRLAVKVGDHPLGYASFEGEIIDGYGKGKVTIWDVGNYKLIKKDPQKFEFEICGKRLRGKYVLVNAKIGDKKENWIFMKIN